MQHPEHDDTEPLLEEGTKDVGSWGRDRDDGKEGRERTMEDWCTDFSEGSSYLRDTPLSVVLQEESASEKL